LDEDLRPAIDRLIATGGRLTVRGIPATGSISLTLDQPGNRFGILEVHARAELTRPDDRMVAALIANGWSDPNVTQRLGREYRIADSGAPDRPVVLARTWRVPPVLASEIELDVRTAAGTIDLVDLQPIGAGRASAVGSPPTGDARTLPATQLEESIHEIGPSDSADPAARRILARTVPAPFRALGAVALVVVLGIAWVGMIRGAPRVAGGASGMASGSEAMVTPVVTPGSTPTPTPTPTPRLLVHEVSASTETAKGPATAAIDGDDATAWHAAVGVPQWIEVDLDTPSTVHEVVLLIAQAKKGGTRHMIQVAKTSGAFEVVGVVARVTADGDAILFRPATPLDGIDRIRIETMASPSDVGWYEVVVS
jgi:hypothetical protein